MHDARSAGQHLLDPHHADPVTVELLTMLHEKSWQTLLLTLPAPGILLVEMQRPDASNALDTVMTRELLDLWQ